MDLSDYTLGVVTGLGMAAVPFIYREACDLRQIKQLMDSQTKSMEHFFEFAEREDLRNIYIEAHKEMIGHALFMGDLITSGKCNKFYLFKKRALKRAEVARKLEGYLSQKFPDFCGFRRVSDFGKY